MGIAVPGMEGSSWHGNLHLIAPLADWARAVCQCPLLAIMPLMDSEIKQHTQSENGRRDRILKKACDRAIQLIFMHSQESSLSRII